MSTAQQAKQVKSRRLTASDRALIQLAKDLSMEPQVIEVPRRVFDLDQRDFVDVVKKGTFTPPTNAEEVLQRVGNDSAKFLEVMTEGLRSYEKSKLAESDSPWMVEGEDGTLAEFAGTILSEEKGKQLNVTVLNLAKTLFSYNDGENITDSTERSKFRAASKKSALDMILSNPASVEALKK